MKKELFNQVVLAIGLYVGVELSPVVDASQIILLKIKYTLKNKSHEKSNL
jgi:hypothetical protein